MASGRRFSLYFAWDKRRESAKPLSNLNDRFPAVFELRRAAWPMLLGLQGGGEQEQAIAGFLDRVVLGDFAMFLQVVQEESGVAPIVTAAVDLDGTRHAIAEAMAGEVHTLVIVSLDHVDTEQRPTAEDVEMVERFLNREDALLVVCPHHSVGGEPGGDDEEQDEAFRRRVQERRHHGDPLVPPIQRLGGYARYLLAALNLPAENRFGLRPAVHADGQPALLEVNRSLDTAGFLRDNRDTVTTFNAHPHLPHFEPLALEGRAFRVLARQPIDLTAESHPFTAAGNTAFNALLWAPPDPALGRRGHVLVCDATLWSAAFNGLDSLTKFWRILARRPIA